MYAHVGAPRRRLENKLAGRRHLLLLTAATEIQWKVLYEEETGGEILAGFQHCDAVEIPNLFCGRKDRK
jgi:hypothetical protein